MIFLLLLIVAAFAVKAISVAGATPKGPSFTTLGSNNASLRPDFYVTSKDVRAHSNLVEGAPIVFNPSGGPGPKKAAPGGGGTGGGSGTVSGRPGGLGGRGSGAGGHVPGGPYPF